MRWPGQGTMVGPSMNVSDEEFITSRGKKQFLITETMDVRTEALLTYQQRAKV